MNVGVVKKSEGERKELLAYCKDMCTRAVNSSIGNVQSLVNVCKSVLLWQV